MVSAVESQICSFNVTNAFSGFHDLSDSQQTIWGNCGEAESQSNRNLEPQSCSIGVLACGFGQRLASDSVLRFQLAPGRCANPQPRRLRYDVAVDVKRL
jgi:hypothetical protein